VIQRGSETSQLLFAVPALVPVSFVNFDAILPDVIVINIGRGNFWLRLYRFPLLSELAARLNLIRNQNTVGRSIPTRFALLANGTYSFQRTENLAHFSNEILFSVAVE